VNSAVVLGKLLRSFIRVFRRGGGSAFPGLFTLKLDPNLLKRALKFSGGIVVVTGSAGKSTTTKLLVSLLRAHGLNVFTNPSTANIEQGLVSAVLAQSDSRGRLEFDIAVLEVDEGHGSQLAELLKPRLSVVTNLMVDQVDRFDDPEKVAEKLARIAEASAQLVLNADDANLDGLRRPNSRNFGSTGAIRGRPEYPDYAPVFIEPSGTAELTVTGLVGDIMQFTWMGVDQQARLVSPGAHVALNTAAALLASEALLGSRFDLKVALAALADAETVFARDEMVRIADVNLRLMLVQNPGSFRLNLALISEQPQNLMIAIGSDVHDPSWLWSVDFKRLTRVDQVSGLNAAELALRLAYQDIPVLAIDPDITSVDSFLAGAAGGDATLIVSADAMRRIRRHLGLAA
jgi:lipid II isoglutaminyl synthase (glutamine-hydrolysing)